MSWLADMLDGHRVLLNAVDVWIFSHGSYHQARTVGFPNVEADQIQQRRYEEGEAAYIMELCSSQGSIHRAQSQYPSCANCGFKNISKTVMDSWPLTVLSWQNHCSARFSKEFNIFIPYSFKCQLLSFIWQLEAVHDKTCCRDAATCLAWVIMSLSWRWVEDSWMLLSFSSGKGLWSSM